MQNIQSIGGKIYPTLFPKGRGQASGFAGELHRLMLRENTHDSASKLVEIGTISREEPTVSHLLVDHPQYGKDCWDIVHSKLNEDKPYRMLPIGQTIRMDPGTKEIVFEHIRREGAQSANRTDSFRAVEKKAIPDPGVPENRKATVDTSVSNEPAVSGTLDKALKAYIGTPYSRLDCYELVVEGMKELGLAYGGKEGIQNQLIQKALDKGLPMNAYLTGEGLIDASSERVYDRTISSVDDPKKEAGELLNELKPILEPGLIVSFSTARRGHTGIVSRYGDTWTFLNSGKLDNNIRSGSAGKGVGEEDLKSEIENWLRMARRRGNSLKIVFGKLDKEKTVSFLKRPGLDASA